MISKSVELRVVSTHSINKKYRYCLEKSWEENKKRALFMLINPSKGTTLKLDNTICNIMNYCAENKYGSFRLVNLFPIMATSTKELSGRLSEGQQDNDTCIRDSLIWADTIYIAWGSDQKKYINRKRTVENMIFEYAPDKDKLCWVDLENKYPRHLRIIEEGWALKQYHRQFKECT